MFSRWLYSTDKCPSLELTQYTLRNIIFFSPYYNFFRLNSDSDISNVLTYQSVKFDIENIFCCFINFYKANQYKIYKQWINAKIFVTKFRISVKDYNIIAFAILLSTACILFTVSCIKSF